MNVQMMVGWMDSQNDGLGWVMKYGPTTMSERSVLGRICESVYVLEQKSDREMGRESGDSNNACSPMSD